MPINQQERFWDHKHTEVYPNLFEPTELGIQSVQYFKSINAKVILELGCGRTGDSLLLSENGFRVVATDISLIALQSMQRHLHTIQEKYSKNISCVQIDMSHPLPFASASFDGVFSRLGIHYFPDNATTRLFGEIHRILKRRGCFVVNVKSVEEQRFSQGKMIEPNVYILDGHIRHFFTMEYMKNKTSIFDRCDIKESVVISGKNDQRPTIEAVAFK